MLELHFFYSGDLVRSVAATNEQKLIELAQLLVSLKYFTFLKTFRRAENSIICLSTKSPTMIFVSAKMQQNNVFTIAKRNVEGQDMLYQSLKLVNGIWILSELKMQPGNPTLILAVKTRAPDVSAGVNTAFDAILHS